MAITNKNKDVKPPVLEEIENDDTPIDDKGKPVVTPQIPTLEELLAKNPDELSASDMDILSNNADELTDEQKVAVGLADADTIDEDNKDTEPEPVVQPKKVEPVAQVPETPEQKEQRYKSQQTEAQIQAEKNRALLDKVEEADKVEPPTLEELKAWVKGDGADWDELTTFEQSMAKRTLMSEKRSQLVSDAVKSQRQVDTWVSSVDSFIDSTDGKPEFIDLSGYEADFRKYAMKDAHRGAPIDVLLSAFLHNLPPKEKKRGSFFEKGGGGERQVTKSGITDADQAANLRINNPREYARQIRAGKIKVDI